MKNTEIHSEIVPARQSHGPLHPSIILHTASWDSIEDWAPHLQSLHLKQEL